MLSALGSVAPKPLISNITNDAGSNIFTLTGYQLDGISEGVPIATNPLVRCTDQFGNSGFTQAFNLSSTGSQETVQFALPPGFAPGVYLVTVFANGTPSDDVLNVQLGAYTTSSVFLQANANPSLLDVVGNGTVKATFALSLFTTLIASGDAAADLIVMNDNLGGRSTTLNGGNGNDILRVENNGAGIITENGGNGDDYFDFSFYAGNLSNIANFTYIEGGGGTDYIWVYDNNNPSNNTYTITTAHLDRSGFGGFFYDSDVEVLTFTSGNGNDTVNVISTFSLTPLNLYSHGGHDTINIGYFGSVQGINAAVTVYNAPSRSTINIDDSADPVPRSFVTMYDGGVLGLAPAAIYWAITDVDATNIYGGSGGNQYFISSGPSTTQTLNMGSGNDTVAFENGAYGEFLLNGQGGTDSVYIFDNNSDAEPYSITDTRVTRPAFTTQLFTIEYLSLTAGNQADTFNFSTSIPYDINVDAGGGNDRFNIGLDSQARFFGNVTLLGGAGNDDAFWKNGSDNWYNAIFGDLKYNVMFDGGAGFNTLSMDDSSRGNTSYQFYADRIYSSEPLAFPEGADVNYYNVSAIGMALSNGSNNLAVYGTSSDIVPGNQITILMNGGNDTATIYPHDALGNPSINGTIGIGGGAGANTLTINDTASTTPINYLFQNLFGAGTTNIAGMGAAGLGAANDFQNLFVYAGDGDDSFAIDSFKSGSTLALLGGGGNDSLDCGNGNLPLNITNIAAFNFDGQDGSDTVNLNNAAETNQWSYVAASASIVANRSFPAAAYSLTLGLARVEQLNVNAGPNDDSLTLLSTAAGQGLSFFGADGNDTLGFASNISGVLGPITFHGEGGVANRILNIFNPNSTGQTVHLDQSSLGAFPGDTYWGAGGALFFDGVNSISLAMGSGPDTVYAQPNLTATVTISGGNPTTAPGDTLYLPLANALNPIVTPTSATAGHVTSDNLQTLTWSGFETGPISDETAPSVLAGSFDASPAPQSFVLQFSEDISASLSAAVLSVVDFFTGQPAPVTFELASDFDPETNTASFRFDPAGLPAGIYTATLPQANVTDAAGNILSAGFLYTFAWVPAGSILSLPSGFGLVVVQQLTIDPGGTLDMLDNDMIVQNGASDSIRNEIISGFNAHSGYWDGQGIISSAAAGNTSYLTTLAYANGGPDGVTDFDGVPTSAGDVLIKYTTYGDADLSADVNGADYTQIDTGFGSAASAWSSGDFNYDAVIDGSDYALIDSAFNQLAAANAQPALIASPQLASVKANSRPYAETIANNDSAQNTGANQRRREIDDLLDMLS